MSRAERRRRTAIIVARRAEFKKLAWVFPYGEDPFPWIAYRDWQDGEEWSTYRQRQSERFLGRCRKVHPLDCGKTHCPCCGGYKRWMVGKTRQELTNDLSFQEQMHEKEEDV